MTEEQKQALIADMQSEKLVLEKWRDDWNARDKVNYQAITIALAALTQPVSPALRLPTREDFEVSCGGNLERNKWHPEYYSEHPTRSRWEAWQNAIAEVVRLNAPHTAPIEPICATGVAIKLPSGVEVDEYHGVFLAKDEVISAIHAAGHQVED